MVPAKVNRKLTAPYLQRFIIDHIDHPLRSSFEIYAEIT